MEDIRRVLAKDSIVTSLQRVSVHVFTRWFGTLPTYKEILQKVADHVGVESRDLR